MRDARILPEQIDVRDPARYDDEITGAVAHDLIRDANFAILRIACFASHFWSHPIRPSKRWALLHMPNVLFGASIRSAYGWVQTGYCHLSFRLLTTAPRVP